jgi:hypothetical protein
MLQMPNVDLTELTKKKVRMLTGHVRGVESRNHFKLDELEQNDKVIVITAPDDLEAITPSFVQGFFAATITKLGEGAITKHYDFTALPLVLQQDFQMGIERLKLHVTARQRS